MTDRLRHIKGMYFTHHYRFDFQVGIVRHGFELGWFVRQIWHAIVVLLKGE